MFFFCSMADFQELFGEHRDAQFTFDGFADGPSRHPRIL
jgi:hypothetical protein